MRRPPPPHPRGTPRTPGSGRKRGTPNRKTVELRQLMGVLAGDVDYQHRLREDFRRRRVHPAVCDSTHPRRDASRTLRFEVDLPANQLGPG